MTLQYGYVAGQNNGQIATMTDALSGEQVMYTYDALKRLAKAETTQSQATYPGSPWWGQSFGYDGWGNMVTKSATASHSGTTMSLTMDPATNRPTTSGFSFDANGNMTGMPSTPSNLSLTYDIENRTGGSWYDQQNQPLDRAGVWNLYGLRGERPPTCTFAVTNQVYNFNGQIFIFRYATGTQTSRNVYFAGRLIQSNGQTVLTDRLGSVRVDESGAKAVYYPYGEQQSGSMGDGREKFGTYTRESATGWDYANQRYYAGVFGRFNAADRYRASAGPADPSSWNRYAYVRGDPVNFNDPKGQEKCGSGFSTSVDSNGNITFHETVLECIGLLPSLSVKMGDTMDSEPEGVHLPFCPQVPVGPAGVSVANNMQIAGSSFSSALGDWRQPTENPNAKLIAHVLWFYDQVKTGGAWDFKQANIAYGDFGNFNYGAAGIAAGFDEQTLLRMAGWALKRQGDLTQPGESGSLLEIILGTGNAVPPYNDQPGDQAQIRLGISYAKARITQACYPW